VIGDLVLLNDLNDMQDFKFAFQQFIGKEINMPRFEKKLVKNWPAL